MQRSKGVISLFLGTLSLLGLALVISRLLRRRARRGAPTGQPVFVQRRERDARSLEIGLPVAAIAVSIVAPLLVLAGTGGIVRTIVVIIFLAGGPGYGLTSLLRIRGAEAVITLSLALSFALDIAVSGLLLYAGIWSPVGSILILAGITMVSAGLRIWQGTEVMDVPREAM